MSDSNISVKFSFKIKDLEYEVVAEPIIYEHKDGSFQSGNYWVEVHMPDGSLIKTDFYPECDELFDPGLDDEVADIISTHLLKGVPYATNN